MTRNESEGQQSIPTGSPAKSKESSAVNRFLANQFARSCIAKRDWTNSPLKFAIARSKCPFFLVYAGTCSFYAPLVNGNGVLGLEDGSINFMVRLFYQHRVKLLTRLAILYTNIKKLKSLLVRLFECAYLRERIRIEKFFLLDSKFIEPI